jgi:hypothetical protein
MKRVEIDYLGKSYTLPNTTAAHVRTEIENGLSKNKPFWLRANFGEGKPQPVDLLITPGIGITVADINVNETTGDVNVDGGTLEGVSHTLSEHDHEELQ